MNDLWANAFGSGLYDGLNPCIFMTCAVFILLGVWLTPSSLKVFWLRVLFVLVYVLCVLAFNFGPAQIILFHKSFIFAAKVIYFILGIAAFVLGILFLKDWFLIRRGLSVKNLCHCEEPAGRRSDLFKGPIPFLITVILAVVLNALSTVWPINNYVFLLGNEAFIKGQGLTVLPLVLSYVFCSLWPLWLVWAFLSIKGLRPSLFKIVCASIFFTASSTLILIFN